MTTLPEAPPIIRACPNCQYNPGSLGVEACPECGTSLVPACIICGYDLKGLPQEGVCPECGTPVAQSYLPDLLQNRSPDYLRQLRSGLSFVLNGILVWVCVMVGGVFVALAGVTGAELLLALAGAGCSLAILFGWWRLTTPDPGRPDATLDLKSRRIIRVAVVIQAGASVFNVGVQAMVWSAAGASAAASQMAMLVGLLALALGLASMVAWVVQFFAAMHYVRWLARRVPDQKLHNQAKRFMWLGPVLYTVGALAVGLGPLIALVMYWNMLDKLRKHIKSMLRGAA